jgi:hypothetical protein
MRRCTALVVMCIALIFWMASALPVSSATRNVVMLFNERRELPGQAALEAEFVRTLTSNSPDHIEIYHETMDLSLSDTYPTLLKTTFAINMRTRRSMWQLPYLDPRLNSC